MNWITKFIKPKIKSLFQKKSSNVEENLWTTCGCINLIYKEELESNQKVCPKCGAHHKLTCRERFKTFFDQKEFEVIAGAQDFRFIGGSFGAASGEAFIAGAQHAIEKNIPYIFFSCSGGQRMMESSIALMQMSRTALAVNELKKKNVPFIVVLTDPTTGGVTASWAMLGDILIAEPKATIGFAGKRVIADTIRETLPPDFQTAEWARDSGQIDLVVERQYLNSTIGTLVNVLLKKAEAQAKQESNVTIDKSLQTAS